MTKIEERAKEWAENHFDEEQKGAAFISYVKGAASQEAIDIEKACEWLKGELFDESTIDPRHPTDIASHTWWTVEEFVNAFRNAMNNE